MVLGVQPTGTVGRTGWGANRRCRQGDLRTQHLPGPPPPPSQAPPAQTLHADVLGYVQLTFLHTQHAGIALGAIST